MGEADKKKKSSFYASRVPLSDADFCPRYPLE
jgi:hypothetical protein